jgi:hypothetical protein
LFCLVLKRWFRTFCACIKALLFQQRSSPVPHLLLVHLQRTGSSQSIFLANPATSFLIHFAGPTCSHSVPYHFDKMLCKSFIASIFLLASISSANAHAGVTPALGVKGQFTRDDVQFPSTSSPCGNVNIAKTLGNSTPVPVGKNGEFSANITDFNG